MGTETAIRPERSIPAQIVELLGPPPLVSRKDKALYYAMMRAFAEIVPRDDMVTWTLAKDLTDARIEIARYRRIKVGLLHEACLESVARMAMSKFAPGLMREALVHSELSRQGHDVREPGRGGLVDEELRRQDFEYIKQVQDVIGACDIEKVTDADLITAFDGWIEKHLRIDILLDAAEYRFKVALRELERYVNGLDRSYRERLDQIIEGQVIQPRKEKKLLLSRFELSGARIVTAGARTTGEDISMRLEGRSNVTDTGQGQRKTPARSKDPPKRNQRRP